MKRKTLRVSVITLCLLLSITVGFTSSVNVKADEEVKIYETRLATGNTDKNEKSVDDISNKENDDSKDLEKEIVEITVNDIESDFESDSSNDDILATEENIEILTEFELKSNEALVGSFDEFRTLVLKKGNGVIDTYYMTDDFIVDKGISVPAGYGFTLDGTNPYTNEMHTYTQTVAPNAAYSFSVNSSGTAARTIEYRNMNIVGTSKKGIIYSFSDTTTQIFNNVTFSGPALSFNASGKTIYNNSTIVTPNPEYSTYLHYGKNLEISGETNIFGVGGKSSYIFYLFGGSMTITENANVTIEHSTRVASMDIFEMKSGSTLTINGKYIEGGNSLINTLDASQFEMSDATLNINGEKGLKGSASIKAKEINIENSKINFDVDSQSDILRADNKINIINSELNLKANYISFGYINASESGSDINIINSTIHESVLTMAGAAIESKNDVIIDNSSIVSESSLLRTDYFRSGKSVQFINGSYFGINVKGVQSTIFSSDSIVMENSKIDISVVEKSISAKNQDLIKAKKVLVDGSEVSIYINDYDIKYVFDVSESLIIKDSNLSPGEFHLRSTFPIGLSKNVDATITIDSQQVNTSQLLTENEYQLHFRRNNYKSGKMIFKVDSNGMPTFLHNDFTDVGFPNPEDYLNLNSARSLSIGTVRLDYVEPITQEKLHFETNVGAEATFKYNETLSLTTKADKDGVVLFNLDPIAKPGYHNLNIVSNGLIRNEMIDYSSFGTVSLLDYPELLNFESLNVPAGHTEYQSKNQSNITVEDTRVNRTGWKLEVRVKTPLHQQNNQANEFTNALIFRNPINKEKSILSSKPLLVYETDELYDEKVNIEFGEMEGILLEFYGANGIYTNMGYGASLEWILTQY